MMCARDLFKSQAPVIDQEENTRVYLLVEGNWRGQIIVELAGVHRTNTANKTVDTPCYSWLVIRNPR